MKKFFLTLTTISALTVAETAEQMQIKFSEIYQSNGWRGKESVSGTGSDLKQTEAIRTSLPSLLKLLKINTMLDAACGDFHWMQQIDLSFLDFYFGVDIVPQMIKNNQQRYSTSKRSFMHKNIAHDLLPKVDLIFCRDCLVHLELKDTLQVLKNFKRSGSKYILLTTFTRKSPNTNLPSWQWRTLNMQLEPFNFPEPIALINEQCTENNGEYTDKSLGLWRLSDINI
ncbi:MAG: class I SAM-dependent methyltransferase [Candidatus Dependentiae bacterium]